MTVSSLELAIRVLVEKALSDPAFIGRVAEEAAESLSKHDGTGRLMIVLDLQNASHLYRQAFAFASKRSRDSSHRERIDLHTQP